MLELILRDAPANVQIADDVRDWYNGILETERTSIMLSQLTDIPIAGVDHRLMSYQRVGVNFLIRHKRCILADDVGLGKTAQVLEAMEAINTQGRVLIICTNSSKYWWREEIEKWFPGKSRIVIESAKRNALFADFKREAEFLIINWEAVRLMPELKQVPWQWIVADEAHRLKDRNTIVRNAVNALHSNRIVLVTATPVVNMPADLWSLLNLLYPERYPSYWRFYEMYVNYTIGWHGYKEINRDAPVRNPELLQRELAPVMLRRTRTQYRKTLPPQYKEIPLMLTPQQIRMYKTMAREMYTSLEAMNMGACILRLRQIVSTTATLQDSDYSSKLDAAVEIITDMASESFVVFTMFRDTALALKKRLVARYITCGLILGMQTPAERTETVKLFQEKKQRVVIATIQAGGESLTLTAAHQVLFIDKHYSSTIQEQAVGRIDRFGQTQQCLVTSLLCHHTVDDLVEEILAYKERMIDRVLQEKFFESLQDSLANL
jgi:SNF2 family DNA or RNA helicase